MMNKVFEDFEILKEYIKSNFGKNLIYDTSDGYTFYDRYTVKKLNNQWVITRLSDLSEIIITNVKHAAAWCILDRYNMIPEAKLVLQLSKNLDSAGTQVLIHSKLKNRGEPGFREINSHKWIEATNKQKQIQIEIDKYIKLAKKCQDRGYQNELTRNARNQKN